MFSPIDGNIGALGRRRRRLAGIIVVSASAFAWAWMAWSGASRGWRLLMLPLLWGGLIALLEARAHTCVVHAARGSCELDQRAVFDRDPAARAANRARARRIMRQAAALALTATLLVMLLP